MGLILCRVLRLTGCLQRLPRRRRYTAGDDHDVQGYFNRGCTFRTARTERRRDGERRRGGLARRDCGGEGPYLAGNCGRVLTNTLRAGSYRSYRRRQRRVLCNNCWLQVTHGYQNSCHERAGRRRRRSGVRERRCHRCGTRAIFRPLTIAVSMIMTNRQRGALNGSYG